MRRARLLRAFCALAAVTAASSAAAQFGHPLKGTWSGERGPDAQNRTRVLLELDWDGERISGTIDPGPNAISLTVATLDPETWKVHFEAEGRDGTGRVVRHVIDGTLENIGAYQRFITGTWSEDGTAGTFKVTRN